MRSLQSIFGPRRWGKFTRTWESDRPSLLSFVAEQFRAGNEVEDVALPDETIAQPQVGWKFAAGALDGISTHHLKAQDASDDGARTVIADCVNAGRNPSQQNLTQLYTGLLSQPATGTADALLAALGDYRKDELSALAKVGKWLATESPDREPVKYGIVLMGLGELADAEREALAMLAKHNEFTLFVASAFSNSLPIEEIENALWQLAENVHGWGRIHLVERLARGTDRKIKNWLLREGFRNSVMNEYLAYICADAGDLAGALRGDTVDEPLLVSAGELIQALINEGPAENILDYADGVMAIRRYLSLVIAMRPQQVATVAAIGKIATFLRDQKFAPAVMGKLGWGDSTRAELLDTASGVLSWPEWPQLIGIALQSPDRREYYAATSAAEVLKLDVWDTRYSRQDQNPRATEWYHLVAGLGGSDERLVALLALAGRQFDLANIATGPGGAMGLGVEYKDHQDLDFVVRALAEFPGRGWPFVRASLASPVIGNRYGAVATLAAWGRSRWPDDVEPRLFVAVKEEPDEHLREAIKRVLAGQ